MTTLKTSRLRYTAEFNLWDNPSMASGTGKPFKITRNGLILADFDNWNEREREFRTMRENAAQAAAQRTD